jgi:hypothetical protein
MNIKENILSYSVFKNIQAKVFDDAVPWYYTDTTALIEENNLLMDNSFNHMVFRDGRPTSPLFDGIVFAFLDCLDKTNQQLKEILRIKIGLITATENTFVHKPHIDFDLPHQTALLYLNSTDGDTIFYKEKLGDNIDNVLTITDRVTPEENKFVYFDGLTYHSSSTPTNSKRRVVINFNYTI